MTELEYKIRSICNRRGVALSKIQSVAASWRITFGLASLTALLPAVASTFYFLPTLQYIQCSNTLTGLPQLRVTNLGGASAGDIDIICQPHTASTGGNIQSQIMNLETDSMLYVVNTFSAGTFAVVGNVFKITYE